MTRTDTGGLAVAAITSLARQLLDLPSPRTRQVLVERDLPAPMTDGTMLLANRWYPVDDPRAPIILMRSPYGRGTLHSIFGRIFAEAGYQVVIQSCRGTFGSGGEFVPFRHERADGKDTFAWLEQQPWFSGRVGLWGGSYVGITQWAVAGELPAYVKAMALSITASAAGEAVVLPGGALALDDMLPWALDNDIATRDGLLAVLLRRPQLSRGVRDAMIQLPLGEADELVLGHPVRYYRDWLEHDDPSDPWWGEAEFRANVDRVNCPVIMSGGWYDIFLPEQLEDFQRLADRGISARVVVGPWGHGGREHTAISFLDALDLFDAELRGEKRSSASAVRLKLIGGGDEWLDFDTWPPPGRETLWHLAPGGRLAEDASVEPATDSYRYDPADPTPGVGGASLHAAHAGPKDQAPRESRADVLTYTSAPLPHARTFIGPAEAQIYVQSSATTTDLHVTVCDVDPVGVSTNVSSGIQRVRHIEPGVVTAVALRLWPVGAVFAEGHRLRVQVSSGAHPTYARNLGTGEPSLTGRSLVVAEQTVHLGASTDSRIRLLELIEGGGVTYRTL